MVFLKYRTFCTGQDMGHVPDPSAYPQYNPHTHRMSGGFSGAPEQNFPTAPGHAPQAHAHPQVPHTMASGHYSGYPPMSSAQGPRYDRVPPVSQHNAALSMMQQFSPNSYQPPIGMHPPMEYHGHPVPPGSAAHHPGMHRTVNDPAASLTPRPPQSGSSASHQNRLRMARLRQNVVPHGMAPQGPAPPSAAPSQASHGQQGSGINCTPDPQVRVETTQPRTVWVEHCFR